MAAFMAHIVATYSETKSALVNATGGSQDLLHVHAGLMIFALSTLLLRREAGSSIPLMVVVGFAAVNEVMDALVSGSQPPFEPLLDFVNTVFWPAVMFLLMRRWKRSAATLDGGS